MRKLQNYLGCFLAIIPPCFALVLANHLWFAANSALSNPKKSLRKPPQIVLQPPYIFFRTVALLLFPLFLYAQSTILTQPNKGRLGDQLSIFSRALYFSYLYDLPLTATPFEFSELFNLSRTYPAALPAPFDFDQIVTVKKRHEIDLYASNALYIIPYHVDNFIEASKLYTVSTPNFNDPEYRTLLKEALIPIDPIEIMQLPKDKTCIAIHLRTGEGKDSIHSKKRFASKFLGKHSALSMLKSLQKELPQREKLYVYLFTDHPSPQKILKWFRKNSPKGVEWGISGGKQAAESILFDLFSMAAFDHIIRPSSNFSLFSLILGNHKTATIVTSARWSKKKNESVTKAFIHTTPEDFFRIYHVD